MEKIKSDLLGAVSLALILVAAIMGVCGNTFGIFLAAVSFILAIVDIVIGYKKEQLAFQEYVHVAVKEKTFSVIAIFGCIVFAFFTPEIIYKAEFAKL